MQPRIVGDLRARTRFGREPFAEVVTGHVTVFEQLFIDLIAHLHRVAPVDEDCGVIERHGGKTGRPAKPRQPAQSLGIIADIFAHVLVGNRDDEPAEPAALQLLAQGFQAGFVGLHQHLVDSSCSRSGLLRMALRL